MSWVEKTARALNREASRQRAFEDDWDTITEQERGGWRLCARAALDAVRPLIEQAQRERDAQVVEAMRMNDVRDGLDAAAAIRGGGAENDRLREQAETFARWAGENGDDVQTVSSERDDLRARVEALERALAAAVETREEPHDGPSCERCGEHPAATCECAETRPDTGETCPVCGGRGQVAYHGGGPGHIAQVRDCSLCNGSGHEREPMRYRKKPLEIEAVQLTWETWNEVCDFIGEFPEQMRGVYVDPSSGEWSDVMHVDWEIGLIIPTLEGDHLARQGDWVIRGIKGELYPCKPDIFEATYDPSEGGEDDDPQ